MLWQLGSGFNSSKTGLTIFYWMLVKEARVSRSVLRCTADGGESCFVVSDTTDAVRQGVFYVQV